MFRLLVLLSLAIILSSCSGNNAAKLSSNIRNHMKKNYGIKDGDVVAKFDLGGLHKDDKLFAPYYGSAINNSAANSKFLNDFDKNYRHKDFIQENSYKKISYLSKLLSKLHKNYKILGNSISSNVKSTIIKFRHEKRFSKKSREDYYSKLVSLHSGTKNIPIFVPIENARITSKFGDRKHPSKKKLIHHCGLDLAGRMGAKIFSAADGVVEEVSRSSGYGNNVVVRHAKNIKTRYAHLSKFHVGEGDKVILGQAVGVQGASGTATGHHLHFEVIINGKTVDPIDFINHSL
jgi:murein DD-endopeptidase MepM/ murein hydrolase activator NlpD